MWQLTFNILVLCSTTVKCLSRSLVIQTMLVWYLFLIKIRKQVVIKIKVLRYIMNKNVFFFKKSHIPKQKYNACCTTIRWEMFNMFLSNTIHTNILSQSQRNMKICNHLRNIRFSKREVTTTRKDRWVVSLE